MSVRLPWAILGGIVTLAAALLLLAPDEQTLGSGIQSVYLHVALTWAGMTGLVAAGLLGLVVVFADRPAVQDWAQTIGWVALTMFALGLAMSVVAARVNWGAIFWQEPRTLSALQLLAVTLIVQIINGWPVPYRLKGTLRLLPPAFMLWSTATTPLVLHPPQAALSSPSVAIQLTFFGLFLLTSLLAAWIVLYWQRRAESRRLDRARVRSTE